VETEVLGIVELRWWRILRKVWLSCVPQSLCLLDQVLSIQSSYPADSMLLAPSRKEEADVVIDEEYITLY